MVIRTKNLLLIPFTLPLCEALMKQDFSDLSLMGIKRGKSWPDQDVLETLPKIAINLSKVAEPTGFESWMIIKKDGMEVIGDAGFKGLNKENKSADLGYGIIVEERRKGFANEAALALIDWAFATQKVDCITARCLEDNHGSIQLLEKLNFESVGKNNEMRLWQLKNHRLNLAYLIHVKL